MANTATDKFDISTCQDISALKDYLKRLRSVDDLIVNKLNATILTTSFQKDEQQNVNNCINFNKQLQEAYASREKVIHTCLTDAEERVAGLKKAREANESDSGVQKEFKRQQTNLKILQKETSNETIIKDRSLKALHEKCMRYINL